MIDFVLGAYLASLAVRGWTRGLVRELVDLVGLVLGVFIAFRLSEPFGDFLAGRFQVTPEIARLGAGIVLMIITGSGLAVAAHHLTRAMKLPGLNLTNRVLGSGLAIAWGTLIALAMVSVVRVLPFPPAVAEALDESVVVERVAGPEAFPRRIFLAVAGDEVLRSLTALRPLVGGDRLVLDADDRVEIPPSDDIEVVGEAEQELFSLANRERVDQAVTPLVWSEGLAEVARAHAEEMYRQGYVSHVSPTTGTVSDRVEAAGIPVLVVGENLGLASSAAAVHLGLMESPAHRENLLRSEFDRVGIGAVQGPLGLMVVEVYAG